MKNVQEIKEMLEGWEKVKSKCLSAGWAWSLTPAESAHLWKLRQEAIDADVPYSFIGRISRLFDRH